MTSILGHYHESLMSESKVEPGVCRGSWCAGLSWAKLVFFELDSIVTSGSDDDGGVDGLTGATVWKP